MNPRLIRTLSEADVIGRWAELYAAGKHAGYAKPNTSQYLGRDSTWVEVEIPHDLYDADWNNKDTDLSSAQIERAERYAHMPGTLPPGMASFTGRRKIKAYVTDGNHRAFASYLRGNQTARFYMPRSDWERFATRAADAR
jgi:hypothetical protein